jgi:predicted ATPase/class 3 adenylate cyclase
MHNLTPEFILQKLAQQEVQGQFDAVVLFVDTSGFTPLTTALQQHGAEGAEIIAQVLANLFTPLVEIVYRHAGFIAGFAGDAFKAIFPGMTAATYQHALTAAWEIRQHLAAHPVQQTRFGDFPFALKVTVADGNVDWFIWQSAVPAATPTQQAATLFAGAALTQALAADPFAKAGEVVLTSTVAAQVRQEGVLLAPVDSHFRLCSWPIVSTLLAGTVPDRATALAELATRFFPAELLTRQVQGEFRRVVTVFINLQQLPSGAVAPAFAHMLFHLLTQYDGYLCRIGQIGDQDQGGTLLFFWGAPTSHEQDVARALHFVLALQAAAPMRLRAGITTQLAYAGFVGAPQREEYTCHGVHVNLAARQMVLAAWDELWLDEETTRLAGAAFVCASQGIFRFKGFAEERAVYRLLGQRESSSAPFYQRALVGRQAELAQLTAALAPLAEGKFAGVLTISGEAGIGKSRLVHELRVASHVTRHSPLATQWFFCQTDEILRQPLNPFRYWLRSYFNQSTSAAEAANKAAFTAKLDELLATLTPISLQSPVSTLVSRVSGLMSELDRTRSFLGALVDLHWPDSLYAQVKPQLRFENTLAALKTLILAESLRQPVILHLEDAHWLDADSHTLLARLTHNVADYPLAMVVTRRPGEEIGPQEDKKTGRQEEEAADRLGLEGPQVLIRLTTLNVDEIRALASAQLQGVPAPALVTLIEERAEGNPFFAEQLLRYLQEQDWLVQGGDGWQLRTEQTPTTLLPNGARALLVARLDQLPQPVKEVVQTAAVLGREFDPKVLTHMLADDQTLAAKLAAADRAAIWWAITQARYLFRHALLREAAYDMQLRERLRRLHHLAGTALEQVYGTDLTPYFGELAYHYDQAEVIEPAVHWYSQAGEQAAKQYANAEALRYFDRAFALTPATALTKRLPLLLGREGVLNLLGQRSAQAADIATLAQMAATAQDPVLQAEVALRQAAYALATGAYQSASAYAEQSAIYAAATDDLLAEARAYHRWGRAHWQAGDYAAAQPHLAHAWQIAQSQRARSLEAQCLYDLALVDYYQEEFTAAQQRVEEAAHVYATLHDLRGESLCWSLSAILLDSTGDHVGAITPFARALTLCRTIGWRYAEARILAQSGVNYLMLGDLATSRQCHEEALTIFGAIADREAMATSLDTIGLILAWQGEQAGAQAHYQQALALHQALKTRRGQGYVLTHLGYTLIALADWQGAAAVLAQALTIRQEGGERGLAIDTLAGCALVALGRGEMVDALRYVDEILAWLTAHGPAAVEFPIQVYLICYKILRALGEHYQNHDSLPRSKDFSLSPLQRKTKVFTTDQNFGNDALDHTAATYGERARQVLLAGHVLLEERANRIPDEIARQRFLQQIPFHWELHALWVDLAH